MTVSATLTTTASGNETPGYPRVNSVPPRSLNCNGYPGLNEYGGNSNNNPNVNAQTNTSTSQSTQMQPPLLQSPGRQPPSRPNSTSNMYQQQQSPSHYNNNVHMSPRSQMNSPLNPMNGGASSQHFQQQNRTNTPTSLQHVEDTQDWNQNTWNSDQPSMSENFNQSDRINLNTRLKSIILNKNEKDQQQSSNNHFLSYSHQHLPEQQQQLNNDKTINNTDDLELRKSKLLETGDVGGSEMNDPWKLSAKTIQKRDEMKSNKFVQKQNLIQNESSDQSQKDEAHKNARNSAEREIDFKATEQESSISNKSASSLFYQQQVPPTEAQNINEAKNDTVNEGDSGEKQSHSYHSAHEYQQHKNVVNHIKKEPCEDRARGSVKSEGYEKNYQNFIRYADFCDAQQPQYESHQKEHPFQQDYAQSQGYYNYPYQNYVSPSQTYAQSHSQNYQQFMSQQTVYQQHVHQPVQQHTHSSPNLTNFEQQIPLHAYPIPKHSSASSSETLLPSPNNIKVEPMFSNSHEASSLLNENLLKSEKDETKLYSKSLNDDSSESSCNLFLHKDEVNGTENIYYIY